MEIAVHLAVAGDVFDAVLFCAVLFSPRDVLDEILDLIESVPTYSFLGFVLPVLDIYAISWV